MIKARDAIEKARELIGTPYSELDCINLIKAVIRDAPGGVKGYTTAGTNTLWDSLWKANKYRDLTWRQDGLDGAEAGMLAFKSAWGDYHHVGIVTGEGTVIHSSSTQGGRGVVETALTAKEGWTHLAKHRYIETSSATPAGGTSSVSSADTFPKGEGVVTEESEGIQMEAYRAIVKLNNPDSALNVRNEPGMDGDVIGKLFHGQRLTVLADYDDGWLFAQYGDSGKSGYISGKYVERIEEEDLPENNVIRIEGTPVIIDDAGNEFTPVGGWRVEWRTD